MTTTDKGGIPPCDWVLMLAVILFAVAMILQLCGCRTYYVYQFGDRPGIYVDAKVDKDISPQVKATVTP
jgi:hypothetical protein